MPGKFTKFKVEIHDSTARIRKFKGSKELSEGEYKVVDRADVFKQIKEGKAINLDGCYIRNFSLSEYKKEQKLGDTDPIQLPAFSAEGAFFDGHPHTDFDYAVFASGPVNFKKAVFHYGGVSFYKSKFSDGEIDFSESSFGSGDANFQSVDFGKGDLSFLGAEFDSNIITFVDTKFGDGEVNFSEVNFGAGELSFHFARFGTGDINFEKAVFLGNVDFRKVEFGSGKVSFRRAHFGNGDISFKDSEFKSGRVNFRTAVFGTGDLSFEGVDFGTDEVTFGRVDFGTGNVSFAMSRFTDLILKETHLDNYLDLRIDTGDTIDLSETVVRDIIDLKPVDHPVNLRILKIHGMRNLGRIFISWKANKVFKLIADQADSSNRQKANQFIVLKEDFNSTGKYVEEDEAYVAFKRYEHKADREDLLLANKLNALWVYPAFFLMDLVFDKTGRYATAPGRVLMNMLLIYVLFSLIYVALHFVDVHAEIISSVGDPDKLDLFEKSFYHSAITFLTIGYGDYYPSGHIRWISSLEGWVGLFMMAYFTVAFVRKILR